MIVFYPNPGSQERRAFTSVEAEGYLVFLCVSPLHAVCDLAVWGHWVLKPVAYDFAVAASVVGAFAVQCVAMVSMISSVICFLCSNILLFMNSQVFYIDLS